MKTLQLTKNEYIVHKKTSKKTINIEEEDFKDYQDGNISQWDLDSKYSNKSEYMVVGDEVLDKPSSVVLSIKCIY